MTTTNSNISLLPTFDSFPMDHIIALQDSIQAITELSELTPVNDTNYALLQLASHSCKMSFSSLVQHLRDNN